MSRPSAPTVRDRPDVIAPWFRGELWAQVQEDGADRTDIPRARLDFAGKGAVMVPEGITVQITSFSLWSDAEAGELLDTHPSLPVVRAEGRVRVCVSLDRYSH